MSQRDSLLVSKGQEEARSSTTLYNVGATLSKGDFSLSGNYYLFREEGYIPQENNFFRPEIWLSYAAFNKYGLNLALEAGYFPTHTGQDDFLSTSINLSHRHEFTSKLNLSSSVNFRSDFDREIDYTNEQEDLVVTKNSPAYHIIGSLRLNYTPINKLSLFAGANWARVFEESFVFTKTDDLAFTSDKSVGLERRDNLKTYWMYSFLRGGLSYNLTDHLSVTEQVYVFMTDGFRDLPEGQIIQNRISMTYSY